MYVLQHPEALAAALPAAPLATGQRAGESLAAAPSLADAATAVLQCYHRTATYNAAVVQQSPWQRQAEFGATRSALVEIAYAGKAGVQHTMTAAIMVKGDAVRAQVVQDRNAIPYSKQCQLMRWVGAEPAKAAAKPK